jgi:hypothetical protein
MLRRIKADPNAKSYVDDATRPVMLQTNEPDRLVELFADKIPHTHGAPQRSAREAVAG